MFFVPNDYADAEILAERIAVRLQHANSAVVLTSVKVILYLMNYIASAEFKEGLCRKLSPPLGAFRPHCRAPASAPDTSLQSRCSRRAPRCSTWRCATFCS